MTEASSAITPLRLLAISGSLRAASSNTAILQAIASLARPDAEVFFWNGLGDIPPFTPDLDDESRLPAPPAVAAFRALLRSADAVVISSPEYAHGVPGSLKNALDWVVGSGELVGKPLALISASRSTFARDSLLETLTVMSAQVVREASVTLALPSNRVDAAALLADAFTAKTLRDAVAALCAAAREAAAIAAGEPS